MTNKSTATQKEKYLASLFSNYSIMKKIPTSFKDDMIGSYNNWKQMIYQKTKNWTDVDFKWVCDRLIEEEKTLPGVSEFFKQYKNIKYAGSENKKQNDDLEKDNTVWGYHYRGYALGLLKVMQGGTYRNVDKPKDIFDREEIGKSIGSYLGKMIKDKNINEEIKKELAYLKAKGQIVNKSIDINEPVKPLKIINSLPKDVMESAKEEYYKYVGVNLFPEELPEVYPETDIPF